MSLRVLCDQDFDLPLYQLLNLLNLAIHDFDQDQLKHRMELLQRILATNDAELFEAIKLVNPQTLDLEPSFARLEAWLSGFLSEVRYLATQDLKRWRKFWDDYCAQVPANERTLSNFVQQCLVERACPAKIEAGITLMTLEQTDSQHFDAVFICDLSEEGIVEHSLVLFDLGNVSAHYRRDLLFKAVTRARRFC